MTRLAKPSAAKRKTDSLIYWIPVGYHYDNNLCIVSHKWIGWIGSGTCSNHTKGNTREDIGIVALPSLKPDFFYKNFYETLLLLKTDTFSLKPFSKSLKGREWRSGCKNSFPLGERVCLHIVED